MNKINSKTSKTKNIVIVTFFFTLGTALGKLLGFIKEITLGAQFGTSYTVDAYVIALNIPSVIFSGITGAFAFSFIPIFMELKGKDPVKAFRFMNNFLNIILIILLIPLLIIEWFPHLFINIFADGFTEQAANLSAQLLRVLFPTVFFTFIIDIFNAYLNSQNKFKVTSIQWVVLNGITLLVFLLLINVLGIYSLVLGIVLGNIVQTLLVLGAAKREGYRYQFFLDLKDPSIKSMFLLSIPAFITSISVQINLLVDRSLVSGLQEGSIAALNYAQKLYFIPLGLVAAPILTVMYPKFTELATVKKWGEFTKSFEANLKLLLFMFIPVFIYFIFFAEEIVQVIYNYGAFEDKSIMLTSIALQFYALAALMQPIKDLLDRFLFSLKLNKLITYASILSMIINVILCFILIDRIGIAGAALSTSIATFVSVVTLFIFLKKFMKDKSSLSFTFGLFVIKCTIASFISLLISKYCLQLLDHSKGFIIVSIVIGAIIYLVITYLLKIQELKEVITFFRRKEQS